MSIKNETLEVIARRRSCRAYEARQLEAEHLAAILEAGSLAPYAQEESRIITVVQDAALLSRLNLAAKDFASHTGMEHLQVLGMTDGFHSLYHAPTLVILSGDDGSVSPQLDCAAATQNMLIAAEAIGVGACWTYFVLQAFASRQGSELRYDLDIPDGFTPHTAVLLGYRQPGSPMPGPHRKTLVRVIGGEAAE